MSDKQPEWANTLKAEIGKELQGVRTEIRDHSAIVKAETKKDFDGLRTDVVAYRESVARLDGKNNIITTIVVAIILACCGGTIYSGWVNHDLAKSVTLAGAEINTTKGELNTTKDDLVKLSSRVKSQATSITDAQQKLSQTTSTLSSTTHSLKTAAEQLEEYGKQIKALQATAQSLQTAIGTLQKELANGGVAISGLTQNISRFESALKNAPATQKREAVGIHARLGPWNFLKEKSNPRVVHQRQ